MKKINFSRDKESRLKMSASSFAQANTKHTVLQETVQVENKTSDEEDKANEKIEPYKKTKKINKRETSGDKETEVI